MSKGWHTDKLVSKTADARVVVHYGGDVGTSFIAKRGFLLSRGHRADLATTRPKRIELGPGSRALLSFNLLSRL